jgi:DNA-directed RNA polymerase specialized sigma24 family protein
LDDTSSSGGSLGVQRELLAILRDPPIRRLALKWTNDRDLAEDVLQAAYCALAALKHPGRIQNLRSYFIRVLRNEVYHLYALQPAVPLEDPDSAQDPALPVDEMVCTSLLAESLFERFAAQRQRLLAMVPARSPDSARYRAVICAGAERVLRDAISEESGKPDSNNVFRAAYPEWFSQPDASANLLHQRFRRAREDVKALLQTVVRRDELT